MRLVALVPELPAVVLLRGLTVQGIPAEAVTALELHGHRLRRRQLGQTEMHATALQLDLRPPRRAGTELQLDRASRLAVRLTIAALVAHLRRRLAPAWTPIARAAGRRARARDRAAGTIVHAELVAGRGERRP